MAAYAYLGFVIVACVMLFVVLPRRRIRAVEALQSQLEEGDEIMTTGGLFGRITRLDQETATLEIAPGVVARFARGAIARRVTGSGPVADGTESDTEPSSADESTD